MMYGRTGYGLSKALLLSVGIAVSMHGQNAERGRCSNVELPYTQRCWSGKDDVWRYTFQGPNDTTPARSWGYTTREAAQRARDSNKSICQIVARYFNKTDCQTEYGEVFCAGCEARDPGQEFLRSDVGRAVNNQLNRFQGELQAGLNNLRSLERTGQANPFHRVGLTTREYADQLAAGKDRVQALERSLTPLNRVTEEVSRLLSRFNADFEQQLNTISSTNARLSSMGSSSQAQTPTPAPQPRGVPAPAYIRSTEACVASLPKWTAPCDDAVEEYVQYSRAANGANLECARQWRAYQKCYEPFAESENPEPRPVCRPPSCQ